VRLDVECETPAGWRWLRRLVAEYPARYGAIGPDGVWTVPGELDAAHVAEVARAAGAVLRGAT
jgi:hypothetical protein